MTSLELIMEQQRTLEATISQRFAELDTAVKSTPHTHTTISSLSKEISCFKEQVHSMLLLLRQQIESVSNAVDSIEMRHRRKYLLFGGIQEVANENIAETVAAICQQNLLLTNVTPDAITVCHRIGSQSDKPRFVLVRFGNANIRNSIWAKKSALKGSSIVLSEFLTRQRQTVFVAARRHFGMHNVWTLDGTIHVKLPSGGKERVYTSEQLQLLTSKHAPVQSSHRKPQHSSSSVPSDAATDTEPVPAPAPSPTPAAAPAPAPVSAPAPAAAAREPVVVSVPTSASSAPVKVPGPPAGSSKAKPEERERRTRRAT